MLLVALGLVVGAVGPARSLPDSLLRALDSNEVTVYSLAIRDVIDALTPSTAAGPLKIALDPNIHRGTTFDPDFPWGMHLDGPSLRALIRKAGIHRLCEPLENRTCRGSIRGMVLRLPQVSFVTPDSARVTILVTAARAEHDNTIMVAQEPRYFAYHLVRVLGRWHVAWRRRNLSSWPTT